MKIALFFMPLLFSHYSYSQNGCDDSIFTNSESMRKRAIELYNEYVNLSNTNSMRYVNNGYAPKDTTFSYSNNDEKGIGEAFITEKINNKHFVQTICWFLNNQIMHISITYKRKNWLGIWREDRYGFYDFCNDRLLYSDERKNEAQNIAALINKAYYYRNKGRELGKISN